MEVQEVTKRPFFSVVISCFNSKATIERLLLSLCNQDLEKDDIEVIISDDCSTDKSYLDIVKAFEDRLNIVYTSTEYNCCPGNTREAGAQKATGEWLCFSDHDDEFLPGALDELKSRIIQLRERYYVVTTFISKKDTDPNGVIRTYKASDSGGWTHGKFFNLDHLWKEFDLHYRKDLLSHEDIYITTEVNCIIEYLKSHNIEAGKYLDEMQTYIWYSHANSLSHSEYSNGVNFLEHHFIDYIQSTGEVYFENYKKGYITWNAAKQLLFNVILLYYFYSMGFIFYHPDDYIQGNFTYLRNFMCKFRDDFGITNREIWNYAAHNNCVAYQTMEEKARIAVRGIIPSMTFGQWLVYLNPIDKCDEAPMTSCYYSKEK